MIRTAARRLVTLVTVVLLVPPSAVGADTSGAPTLRSLALERGVYVGTMFATFGSYRAEEASAKNGQVACLEFNMLTPGNAFKFRAIHPEEGKYEWGPTETLMTMASQCGMRVVGSPLVWHEQLPDWLEQYDGQPQKVRTILRKHVQAVVRRFAGRVAVWDVVNEAVAHHGGLRQTFWLRNLGPGYIADAFRWARQADSTAKLYYNDYHNEGFNKKSNAIYRWVQRWKREGAPIDGVGMQMHTDIYGPSWRTIAGNMARLAELGLATRISEMDVRLDRPAGEGRIRSQAWVFYNAAKACFARGTGCRMLTVWGLTDRHWIDTTGHPGLCCGVLFDEAYSKKPAYFAVQSALKERR